MSTSFLPLPSKYRPIALPADIASFPQVKRLVWKLERHYYSPVRAILRLPLPHYRIEGQFSFSVASTLLAAIAGLSTTVFEQSGYNGDRFRKLVEAYYPFAQEPAGSPSAAETARLLWSVFRNSLAHDLGFDVEKKSRTKEIKLVRAQTRSPSGRERGLTEAKIAALEDSSVRPSPKPTVRDDPGEYVLSVDILYWGTRCLSERLLADRARVTDAETFLANL